MQLCTNPFGTHCLESTFQDDEELQAASGEMPLAAVAACSGIFRAVRARDVNTSLVLAVSSAAGFPATFPRENQGLGHADLISI